MIKSLKYLILICFLIIQCQTENNTDILANYDFEINNTNSSGTQVVNKTMPLSKTQVTQRKHPVCMVTSVSNPNYALFRQFIHMNQLILKARLYNLDDLKHNDQFAVHWTFVPTRQNNTFQIRSSKKTHRSTYRYKTGYDYFYAEGTTDFIGDRHVLTKLVEETKTDSIGSEFNWRVQRAPNNHTNDTFLIWNVKHNELIYPGKLIPGLLTIDIKSKRVVDVNDKKYHWYIRCADDCIY